MVLSYLHHAKRVPLKFDHGVSEEEDGHLRASSDGLKYFIPLRRRWLLMSSLNNVAKYYARTSLWNSTAAVSENCKKVRCAQDSGTKWNNSYSQSRRPVDQHLNR